MAGSSLFIAGVEHLAIAVGPGRGERVQGLFNIATDHRHLSKLLSPATRAALGSIETHSLLDGRPVVYGRGANLTLGQGARELHNWAGSVAMFLHTLWYLKDHSISLELAYLIRDSAVDPTITRSFLGRTVPTDSTGTTRPVTLSLEEFRTARTLFMEHINRGTPGNSEMSRFDRASVFVGSARATQHPAIKIAHYCSALESLLSFESSELSHKLSERVAWMLTTTHADWNSARGIPACLCGIVGNDARRR